MRVFVVILVTFIFMVVGFWTIKFWGRSQLFFEYNHPMLTNIKTPVLFYQYPPEKIETGLKSNDNLYLDIANTIDQKMVIVTDADFFKEKQIRNQKYDDIKDHVLLLSN